MKPPPDPFKPRAAADVPPPELPADDPRCCLSALADGEADAADTACSLWRKDISARQTWHVYHLIGDVLRSEELARSPPRDAAFLASLRERLQAEPVVLAPSASAQPVPVRRVWVLPAAAAAGFVAVAGVWLVLGLGTPGVQAPAGVLAGAPGPGGLAVSNASVPAAALPQGAGGFIRDPRLAEYLRAHQSAGGGVAAASPGGTLRRVDVAVPPWGGRP